MKIAVCPYNYLCYIFNGDPDYNYWFEINALSGMNSLNYTHNGSLVFDFL